MSVLVTGGTGALGYHLLSVITGTRKELHSYSDEMPQPWQQVQRANYHTGNILDFREILQLLREIKPLQIYHLASQSSVGLSYTKPYETLSTNILGTQNLLEAVRQVVPKSRVLLLSSSEIYGRGNGLLDVPHGEEDPANPLTPFATSKACMELVAHQFRNAHQMHISIARPFHFTGPSHSSRFVLPSIAHQLILIRKTGGEPVLYTGNLDVSRDIVDVRDLARALVLIMNAANSGEVYNVCSGRAHTIRELTQLLIGISGIDVDLRLDPALERSHEIPLLIGTPQKIMENLGWRPMISVEDSLLDLYREMELRVRREMPGKK